MAEYEYQEPPREYRHVEHYTPAGFRQEDLFVDSIQRCAEYPRRVEDAPYSIMNDVNDWHMPMLNDVPRNQAYKAALEKIVGPDDVVLEIGAGSGILSLLAAKAGAKHVFAIEASRDFEKISKANFEVNEEKEKITLIQEMSTNVEVRVQSKKRKLNHGNVMQKYLPQRCTILVAELLGTMLDGESTIHYYADARKRLLAPNAKVLPSYGIQYASLIGSEGFQAITESIGFDGLNLRKFNQFRDSVSIIFSKNFGVTLNNPRLDLKMMSEPMVMFEVDFQKDGLEVVPRGSHVKDVKILEDGTVQAIMYWWEVYLDEERTIKISTHPFDTKDNVPRDLNWGQAVQLVEGPAGWDKDIPSQCVVEKGETASIRFNFDETKPNAALFHARVINTKAGERIQKSHRKSKKKRGRQGGRRGPKNKISEQEPEEQRSACDAKQETSAEPEVVKQEATGAEPEVVKQEATGAEPEVVEQEATGAEPEVVKQEATSAEPDVVKQEATAVVEPDDVVKQEATAVVEPDDVVKQEATAEPNVKRETTEPTEV